MEGARPGRRVAWAALGVVVIAVALCWSLFWWLLAVLFSGSDVAAVWWLTAFGGLAVGVLLFALGVGLVLGRRPGRWGWVVVGVYALLLFAVPVVALFENVTPDPVASVRLNRSAME